jgi:uncharacterized protein (DUF427 family)
MKAIWRDKILASSDKTIVVEGNHYFPADSLDMQFFHQSDKKTVCSWKGVASYYDVNVDGELNNSAAWYYSDPKSEAMNIAGYVAFWKGVQTIND